MKIIIKYLIILFLFSVQVLALQKICKDGKQCKDINKFCVMIKKTGKGKCFPAHNQCKEDNWFMVKIFKNYIQCKNNETGELSKPKSKKNIVDDVISILNI